MKCPDCTNELEKIAEASFRCDKCRTVWMILNQEQLVLQYKEMDKVGFFSDEKFMDMASRINKKTYDETSGEKGI